MIVSTAAGCSLSTPPDCTTGVTKCTNDSSVGLLFTCVDEKWSDPVACEGNAKCAEDGISCEPPECDVNQIRCRNTDAGGVIETCSEERQWDNSVPCEENLQCLDEQTCVSPERCEAGTFLCTDTPDGGVVTTCNQTGHWSTPKPCKGNRHCLNESECEDSGSCSLGETLCVDIAISSSKLGNLMTCTDESVWSSPVACPGNAPCKTSQECADPPANPNQCQMDHDLCTEIEGTNIGQIIRCESGEFSLRRCPGDFSCLNETECGSCTNGTTKCEGGTIYTCQNGQYVESDTCETNECFDETRCQQCTQTCHNDGPFGRLVYTCEGHEPKETPCNDVSCNPEKTDCGECMNSTKGPGTSCVNDENEVGAVSGCQNGKELNNERCENDYSCHISNYYCGSCHNHTVKCDTKDGKSYLHSCTEGLYDNKGEHAIACPDNSRCNSEGTACEGFETICAHPSHSPVGRLFFSDGTFRDCENVSCNPDNTACGECLTNTQGPSVLCTNDANGHGTFQGCDAGKVTNQQCSKGASCTNGKCGECHNGDWKCQNDASGTGVITLCENGSWSDTQNPHTFSCPQGVPCDATGCADSQKTMCVNGSDGKGNIAFKQKNGYSRYHCQKKCGTNGECECSGGDFRCEEDENGIGKLVGCNGTSNGLYYWGNGPGGEPQIYSCNIVGCNSDSTFCDTNQSICVTRSTRPVGYTASYVVSGVSLTACPSGKNCDGKGACSQ